MIRKPIVAGTFYESEKEALYKQIKECFLSEFGPGNLPGERKKRRILGVVAPHAGYMCSGPCAAYAYREIAESEWPEVFILLGLSHSGYSSCISLDDWETPLGIAENYKKLGKALMENTSLKQNEEAHSNEHSIEVQVPFLQFINKDNLKIVPIIASPDVPYVELGKNIAKTIKQSGKKVCILASSDFTHYGINYGYFPFKDNVRDNLYNLDNGALKHIKNLDTQRFLDYTEETGATICGKFPVAVMMEACKALGGKHAKLLKYHTSGEITGDYSSVVGYGSIVIE